MPIDIILPVGSQPFPPYPPKAQWDFSSCPEDQRFTCLLYECNRIAQEEDPSLADRLDPSWKIKYSMWPGTPYLEIPEKIRRQAQPEFDPEQLEEIKAREVIPTATIPPEVFDALQTCNALGEAPIYEKDGKAYVLLEISRGMAPENLLAAVAAYVRRYHVPKALTIRPEGGGSYARKFQADLNALTAHILLQTLKPEEATVITGELLAPADKKEKQASRVKRGLFSTTQKWREAGDRGAFLVKKTLEGQLTTTLLLERLEQTLPTTKNE